jgi:hypothetical protein
LWLQVVEQLEAKVQLLTEELIQSASAITATEARAASCDAAAMDSLQARHSAERHAQALERSVEDEVARKLRSVGSDRAQWPQVALQEVRAAEAKATVAAAQVSQLATERGELAARLQQCEAQLRLWQVLPCSRSLLWYLYCLATKCWHNPLRSLSG